MFPAIIMGLAIFFFLWKFGRWAVFAGILIVLFYVACFIGLIVLVGPLGNQ
jgi:hypothetical protein